MSNVNVINVIVGNPKSRFIDPISFEIFFEVLQPLKYSKVFFQHQSHNFWRSQLAHFVHRCRIWSSVWPSTWGHRNGLHTTRPNEVCSIRTSSKHINAAITGYRWCHCRPSYLFIQRQPRVSSCWLLCQHWIRRCGDEWKSSNLTRHCPPDQTYSRWKTQSHKVPHWLGWWDNSVRTDDGPSLADWRFDAEGHINDGSPWSHEPC